METIGERIRRERERLYPRNQKELANKMGVTVKTVSRWETGEEWAAAFKRLGQPGLTPDRARLYGENYVQDIQAIVRSLG